MKKLIFGFVILLTLQGCSINNPNYIGVFQWRTINSCDAYHQPHVRIGVITPKKVNKEQCEKDTKIVTEILGVSLQEEYQRATAFPKFAGNFLYRF